MRDIDGITYMNDGDWVESCTALVEHHNGEWEILHRPLVQEKALSKAKTKTKAKPIHGGMQAV